MAVRMPSHPVARALIRAAGVPVAAAQRQYLGPSQPHKVPPMVAEDMDGRIDMLVDGGEVGIGLGIHHHRRIRGAFPRSCAPATLQWK